MGQRRRLGRNLGKPLCQHVGIDRVVVLIESVEGGWETQSPPGVGRCAYCGPVALSACVSIVLSSP